MQCADSLRVQAYFDDELDAVSAAAVERHIEHCPECRTLLDELGQLREGICRDVPRGSVPPTLRARIARALEQESAAARVGRLPAWRTRPFWLGAFGGLGAALAAG